MSMPKVSLSPDDATGLVHVKAEWTFDPRNIGQHLLRFDDQALVACKPLHKELAVLLAMMAGLVPTEKVAT